MEAFADDSDDIENLLSLIARDDNVFNDLDNFLLPAPPVEDQLLMGAPIDMDEFDQLLMYYDALEHQPLMNQLTTGELPHQQATPLLEPHPSTVGIDHDHTYACKDDSAKDHLVPPTSDDVMSFGRVSDEESNSDGGYETMSNTSPSNNSSCSSISKLDRDSSVLSNTAGVANEKIILCGPLPAPAGSNSQDPPAPFIPHPAAISDPVKLIDERIKYFMSRQQVHLTEEEKETLITEGLPIPTTLPLTKTEEKALKTVRRKIRNKLAAQESRKKKKHYLETLEDKLKHCSQDNRKLMKKVETLETENKTLREQLVQLQTLVARATNPLIVGGTARSLQLGSCLMVVVLCFGILFSNLLPYTAHLSSDASYATTGTVRSRALLSIDSPSTVWSNLKEFYHALLPQDLAPPITTRYYDNMYDFEPPNDNTTSTSEHQTLPVVRTKA